MRKKVRGVILTILAFTMCFAQFSLGVIADELPAAAVPVQITLEGTLPETEEEFTVVLKAEDVKNPMPKGSVDGVYTMTLKGASEKSFPEMSYSGVGIYTYTIHQEAGKNTKCEYDKSIYHLTVTVTNAENGDGLEVTTALRKNDEKVKVDKALFHNVYETIVPEVPQTGDTMNVGLFAGLMIGSIIVMAAIVFLQKRKIR